MSDREAEIRILLIQAVSGHAVSHDDAWAVIHAWDVLQARLTACEQERDAMEAVARQRQSWNEENLLRAEAAEARLAACEQENVSAVALLAGDTLETLIDRAEAAEKERNEALSILFRVVKACGEDTDGTDRFLCSKDQAFAWALSAVGQLRSDYDESLQESAAAEARLSRAEEALRQEWQKAHDRYIETPNPYDEGRMDVTGEILALTAEARTPGEQQ